MFDASSVPVQIKVDPIAIDNCSGAFAASRVEIGAMEAQQAAVMAHIRAAFQNSPAEAQPVLAQYQKVGDGVVGLGTMLQNLATTLTGALQAYQGTDANSAGSFSSIPTGPH